MITFFIHVSRAQEEQRKLDTQSHDCSGLMGPNAQDPSIQEVGCFFLHASQSNIFCKEQSYGCSPFGLSFHYVNPAVFFFFFHFVSFRSFYSNFSKFHTVDGSVTHEDKAVRGLCKKLTYLQWQQISWLNNWTSEVPQMSAAGKCTTSWMVHVSTLRSSVDPLPEVRKKAITDKTGRFAAPGTSVFCKFKHNPTWSWLSW